MGIKLRQNIKVNDQFFDDNQVEPTNSACGVAATKSIHDYYYPNEHITLLEMIRLTPLLKLVNGTWTRNQTGLTCEQIMALCFRLKLNAHLEVLNTDKLKTYLDNEQPVIVLEDDRDISLFDDSVMLRQDHSGGYHFVVAVDHGVNPKGRLVIYTVDSDRVDPKSNFGQDVPIPEAMLSKAMYDSDQRDVCVIIDGALSVQVDHVASLASGCNFRIQPTLQSFVQFGLSGGSQVEVLKDATVNSDGHTWQRCRSNDGFIGWIAQEFISNTTPTSKPRKFPIGPAYVIPSGDQLNVRVSPNITSQSIGKLKALTPVMVLSDDPQRVGNYTWYHIMSDTVSGWVAGEFLDTGVSPQNGATDALKHVKSYVGIHYLNSTQKQGFLDFIKRLHDKGKHLASVTVVNDFDASNAIKKLSPDTFVLFRTEDGTNPTPEGNPNKVAQDWFNKCLPKIKLAPTANAYQLANEWGSGNVDWLSKFYAALSNIAKQNGVIITVGDIAVGNIQDTEIPLLKPMLDVAQSNGHLLNYHMYSCNENGDTDVMCQSDFYVNRWKKWLIGYPNLRIIFGEAGNYSADFISIDQTIKNIKALNDNLIKINDGRVIGFNYWTFSDSGGWSRSSIDTALPQIEEYLSLL